MQKQRQSLLIKPHFIRNIESLVATNIPISANAISLIKLIVVTPLFAYFLLFSYSKQMSIALFLIFGLLDYLDGIVAKYKSLETRYGMLLDRVTDYPLLLLVSYKAMSIIPTYLIMAKIAVYTILFLQYIYKNATTENRIRSLISYFTLFAMLGISLGYGRGWLGVEQVRWLIYLNILFSLVVVAFNARVFKKRFIADTISALNLTCGLFSIYFAHGGEFEMSMLMLIIGALFDGLDGAAAREWGGTRWGVYSDDVADAVNYAIAPAFALYFALGSDLVALVVGLFFAIFTISRLIYFTLNKSDSDPAYFHGVPSTAGALAVMAAIILYANTPVLVGLIVGISATLMVSFDTHYKHLGRAMSEGKKRYKISLPLYSLLLIFGSFMWGIRVSVFMILITVLAYGFVPLVKHFYKAMSQK